MLRSLLVRRLPCRRLLSSEATVQTPPPATRRRPGRPKELTVAGVRRATRPAAREAKTEYDAPDFRDVLLPYPTLPNLVENPRLLRGRGRPRVSFQLSRESTPYPLVFMDFWRAHENLGRVVIQLFDSLVPAKAAYFRDLCSGVYGHGYQLSRVYRVSPDGTMHAGDLIFGNGTGVQKERKVQESAAEQAVHLSHCCPGIVSMARKDKSGITNTPFFVTTSPAPELDGRYDVVGKVVYGLDIVYDIVENSNLVNYAPDPGVWISLCGEL